ncbi:hypothetical protein PI125_g459 [Phytophthora idaei]|nr:hypothetical protein PI125_g459 [Phytophthora idaei]
MVLAPKITSKQATAYFFTPVLDEQDESTSFYRCQCSTVRKQDPGTGYSNLLSHARQTHPDLKAIMKKTTALRLLLRNATRWSSTFAMITRFFALKDFNTTEDDKIAALIPSRREETQLKLLLEGLKDFESASLKLQSAEGVSLLDCYAAIVHDPEFETACVSALFGESESLPAGQRRLLQPFESRARGTEATEFVTAMSFAERALKRRKEERQGRI